MAVDPFLAALAGLLFAVWGVWFAAVVIATRPRSDDRLPADFAWSDEPPAVAALLCSPRGELPERAVTATYHDLLARGFLHRTEGPDGQARITATVGPGLRPYERHVLDHVTFRARIGDGKVLENVLHLESSEHAKVWMKTFTDQCVADARGRGLVMERISLNGLFWLWVGLAVPAGLAMAAGAWVWLCLLAYAVLAWRALVLHRPLPTSAGWQAADVYRALRVQLRTEAGARGSTSSSAGRTVAYAVALGLGGPDRSPFAPQDNRNVWSHASGTWRQVRIVDAPSFLSGVDPVSALYAIPGALVFCAMWGRLLFWYTTDPPKGSNVPALVLIAGWLLWAVLSFLFGRFVCRGLYDLRHGTAPVAGQVIFLETDNDGSASENASGTEKRYHVAIDDGQADVAVKYEIDEALFARLRYGNRLRLEVTPKLRCVKSAQIIPDDWDQASAATAT